MVKFRSEQFNLDFAEPETLPSKDSGVAVEEYPDQAEKILAKIGVILDAPGNRKEYDLRQFQYEAVKEIAEGRKNLLAYLIVDNPELYAQIKERKKNSKEFSLDFYQGLLPDESFSKLKKIESQGLKIDIRIIPLAPNIPVDLNFIPHTYIFTGEK